MERGSGRLNQFGATVMALMAERGITQFKKLSLLMADAGEPTSPSKLSNWFYGRNAAPPWVPRIIAGALKLDNESKARLAMAYTYGQDVFVDEFSPAQHEG